VQGLRQTMLTKCRQSNQSHEELKMDITTLGVDALEAAFNASAYIADNVGNLLQAATEENGAEITCEICRCDW
jgi:hypothetical protein